MLQQLDAGYSTPSGEVLLFNDTTKSLLLEIAQHAATGAFSTFKISSYPANFLNAGQCIFAVDSLSLIHISPALSIEKPRKICYNRCW